ncbi:2-phospho-L-lactate guanylyltransferase [Marinibaculum pumilum]|uniref:3-phospho-D-glycerate guanylyltransferase n=1 Tax=Marinibaculum pumilum TaxID=1766165 RepID=A0ABV7KZP2_9PROT
MAGAFPDIPLCPAPRAGAAWALVPVKRLDRAKSRLAPRLSPAGRQALQRAMLAQVLSVLRRASGLDGIAVVTADPAVAAIAARFGARQLPERREGLNPALSDGAHALRAAGAGFVAVVPADLPELDAADISAALAEVRRSHATLVVPDAAGSGTNGLVFPADRPPRFAFGAGSCRHHLAQPGTCRHPLASLARDVDLPRDLAALDLSFLGLNAWRMQDAVPPPPPIAEVMSQSR